jgi:UDPglucose 6-dehydrogenase
MGLVNLAQKHQSPVRIVESAVQINASQRLKVFRKIEKALVNLKDKTVAIAGLAFKPNTDDVREAPALTIIKKLLTSGAYVRAYDPVAIPATKKVFPQIPQIEYCKDVYDAAKGADCLVLMTEWNEFRNLDFAHLKRFMKHNIVVDCRNIYPQARLQRIGFKYFSIGRGKAK